MTSAPRLDHVLDATYACLTRHGVRRTTMDDIAREAGMSRSAVYQYVRNKDDAVRRLAARLHLQATERASAAAESDAPWQERVRSVLQVKLDLVLELAGDSPHTAELLDAKARLYGDICITFTGCVGELLTSLFAEASPSGTAPEDAAAICTALVTGLESTPDNVRLLPTAVDLLTAGLATSDEPA